MKKGKVVSPVHGVITYNAEMSFLNMLQAAYHANTTIRLGNDYQAVEQYDRITMGEAIEHRFLLSNCVIAIVERKTDES